MKTLPLYVMCSLLLANCATIPTPAQNAAADHGPSPSNYEEIVHTYIKRTFLDPYSVRDLQIEKPKKGWMTGAPLFGEPSAYYGWDVVFTLNGKNSFGAYTGLQTIDLLVRNGEIVKVMNLTHPELTGGSVNAPSIVHDGTQSQ